MRVLDRAADALLAWCARHADQARRPWIEALRAELDAVEGGPAARLRWALGGLSMRRSEMIRALLRTGAFGLALGAVLVVVIVWTNVIVPATESDDEYTGWYVAFLAGLLAYFFVAGLASSGRPSWPVSGAGAGAVTGALTMLIILVTFIVVDNLFLDVVMRQPDKLHGFQRSGLASQRDYVNQSNLLVLVVAPTVLGGLGAACGTVGGLVRQWLAGRRRPSPAGAPPIL
jgi:hypothetical protein